MGEKTSHRRINQRNDWADEDRLTERDERIRLSKRFKRLTKRTADEEEED